MCGSKTLAMLFRNDKIQNNNVNEFDTLSLARDVAQKKD